MNDSVLHEAEGRRTETTPRHQEEDFNYYLKYKYCWEKHMFCFDKNI